jgi:hypothetical protein
MILDASWAVWRGLSLSAMVGFDDISARSFGIPDGDIPTIPGAVVGADYSLPLAGNAATGKIFMNLHLEGGYTHYLWGNFHYDDPPFDDPAKPKLLLPKAIYRYAPNHSAVVYPLTSPYGPGAVWAAFAAEFTFPERSLRAGLDFLFLTKNSEVNLVDTVYSIDDATKDIPRVYNCALSLPAVYTWRWFDFSFAPGFRLLAGPGGVKDASFEFTVGVRFGMEGKKRFAGPY